MSDTKKMITDDREFYWDTLHLAVGMLIGRK